MVVAVCLLLCGCFEGFEQLVTRVKYDPFAQTFEVERRLVNIGERFFACGDGVDCAQRVRDILSGEASGEAAYAPAAQLRDRLVETGAEDIAFETVVTEQGLDIVVRYRARLGTRAAEETRVHVEHEGRGRGGRYRLVVDAQDRMTMDRRSHRVRKRAQGGSGLLTWREEWVLRPGARELVLRTPVATAIRSVLTHDDVASVLADYNAQPLDGLSPAASNDERVAAASEAVTEREPPAERPHDPAPPKPVAERPAPSPVVTAAAPAETLHPATPETATDPEPIDREEEAPRDPRWDPLLFDGSILPPVDPKGWATTYVHEAQVVGAPLPETWSEQLRQLGARSERCYQRQSDRAELTEGHAFLEISLKGGEVVGTAVYGEMDDTELMRCLREGLESWAPPSAERHTQGTRWTLPVTFRNEKQRRRRR